MPNSSPKFSYIDYNAQTVTIKRLRQLSRLLDTVITVPGTPIAIGLDPIIGFIPIGGDVLGLILSSYIVYEASRLGVPKKLLSRMIFNIIIDSLLGSFPIIGDLFDFAWTANHYNIKLLEKHLNGY
ncbi:DUF4112 domain-containing protein [Anabaena subtropica]|uniref:DUF4112 domain-containing protein n=1 Tax=Anabaena subtropica FACHB-260 TaxID=2692884 RepID=A0ABR8CLF6_9NOST|nr:DUF4112 domain-containing protein [Anabaena subtropica]MBD2343658.1 DUF4112 domain-containing protein [Anabaena subtropica FACHB-260]